MGQKWNNRLVDRILRDSRSYSKINTDPDYLQEVEKSIAFTFFIERVRKIQDTYVLEMVTN